MSSEIRQALKSIQGFCALDDAALDDIVPMTTIRTMRAGETIFCQGEPSPYCFGVITGEVTIQNVLEDSRFPPKTLGIISAGNLFGESSIFEDGARVAMGSASKDGKLAAIRGTQLRQWLRLKPEAGQPLLIALLRSSLSHLHRTSHELAVVYCVGRLLGSDKSFPEQLEAVLDFLKTSLPGLDDVVFFERSVYWEEFSPVMSAASKTEIPALPLSHELVRKVKDAGYLQAFDPKSIAAQLSTFKLPWENRAAIAIVPIFNWEKSPDSLQGLLVMSSVNQPHVFSGDKQLLLMSVTQLLSDGFSRHLRHSDLDAQNRLRQAKTSYPQM